MVEMIRLLLVFALIAASAVNARNPGFKARITSNGLNYANKVALQALKKSIETTKIPDQSGKSSGFKYSITNIHVASFAMPDSAISITPNQGLKWNGTGAMMSVAGDFHYKKSFIRGSGSFTAAVSGVYFSLGISMGTDKNGRPSIASQSCDSGVGDVNFKFHGGMSWLYNLFRKKVSHVIKNSLTKQLCTIVKKQINVNAEDGLAKIPVTTILANMFLLDYRLTENPIFTASYMEMHDKGEIYWYKKQTAEAPMQAPVMPESRDAQKMMYLWLSDYVFNTFGYVAQTNNVLVYNLTADELPPISRAVLDTTCPGFLSHCIGKLIPELGAKYPNTLVELHMRSTVAPTMNIGPSGIAVTCGGDIDMWVKAKTGLVFVATLKSTMLADVNVKLTNETLYSNIKNLTFTLVAGKSTVGPIKTDVLQVIINDVLQVELVDKLNDLGRKGFPLPVNSDIRFVNTKLTLMQDALLIATDLSYSPKGFVQKEKNEIHRLVYKAKALPGGASYKLRNTQM